MSPVSHPSPGPLIIIFISVKPFCKDFVNKLWFFSDFVAKSSNINFYNETYDKADNFSSLFSVYSAIYKLLSGSGEGWKKTIYTRK